MQNSFKKAGKAMLLPLVLYLLFLILTPTRFGTVKCLTTILYQSFIPTVIGYGMSFGFICGIFDFTIGSRVIIAAIAGGILSLRFGVAGLVIGCLVAGVLIATVTGLVNRLARIPSLVVTFGLAMIFEIFGQWLSGKSSMVTLNSSISFLGNFPYNVVVMVLSFILFYAIFYRTKFSFQTLATGSDEIIAKNMGINVQSIKFLTFVVSGVFLGIASIMQISYAGSVGSQINLESVTTLFRPMIGVIIGLAVRPVCNLAIGIFIGEFSINIIFVGLIALGMPDTFQNVILGVFLLIVMILSSGSINFKPMLRRKTISASTKG